MPQKACPRKRAKYKKVICSVLNILNIEVARMAEREKRVNIALYIPPRGIVRHIMF